MPQGILRYYPPYTLHMPMCLKSNPVTTAAVSVSMTSFKYRHPCPKVHPPQWPWMTPPITLHPRTFGRLVIFSTEGFSTNQKTACHKSLFTECREGEVDPAPRIHFYFIHNQCTERDKRCLCGVQQPTSGLSIAPRHERRRLTRVLAHAVKRLLQSEPKTHTAVPAEVPCTQVSGGIISMKKGASGKRKSKSARAARDVCARRYLEHRGCGRGHGSPGQRVQMGMIPYSKKKPSTKRNRGHGAMLFCLFQHTKQRKEGGSKTVNN